MSHCRWPPQLTLSAGRTRRSWLPCVPACGRRVRLGFPECRCVRVGVSGPRCGGCHSPSQGMSFRLLFGSCPLSPLFGAQAIATLLGSSRAYAGEFVSRSGQPPADYKQASQSTRLYVPANLNPPLFHSYSWMLVSRPVAPAEHMRRSEVRAPFQGTESPNGGKRACCLSSHGSQTWRGGVREWGALETRPLHAQSVGGLRCAASGDRPRAHVASAG